jgi:hypothetical protein
MANAQGYATKLALPNFYILGRKGGDKAWLTNFLYAWTEKGA